MNTNYPIKPAHLDTKNESKGFDMLLEYDQRAILWAFMQLWKHKGNWDSFTHDEFIAFISDHQSEVNKTVRCGIIWFVQTPPKAIIRCTKDEGKKTVIYEPTHYAVSTYFHWNPST